MKFLKALTSFVALLVLIITALFIDFTYKTFSAQPRTQRVDAIVVLAGGKGRIEEGIRLFKAGVAPQLFLIGVDPSVRKADLYRPRPGEPAADRVVLEQSSRNTLENALYGRDLLTNHKVRSLVLLTSRYHLKRSSLLFRTALPPEVAIYPYPVDSERMKQEWWYHLGSFRLLFSEFYKYCLFRGFFLFSSGELQPVRL